MMTNPSDLLGEIERFLNDTGMGPTYFGKVSCGNSELVDRLRAGGDVRTRTAKRVLNFISSKSPSSETPSTGVSDR